MMPEDEYDEDEEESGLAPLVNGGNHKKAHHHRQREFASTKKQQVSFEMMTLAATATNVVTATTTMRSKVLFAVMFLVTVFAAGSLIRLGFSSSRGDELAPLLTPQNNQPTTETCEQRFGISYRTLLGQVVMAESFCSSSRGNSITGDWCRCKSPFVPDRVHSYPGRNETSKWNPKEGWNKAFKANKAKASAANPETPYDVVFFGDSITERFNGVRKGKKKPELQENRQVFDRYFNKSHDDGTAAVEGLTMGIGGDRCPQLLYRIQNGELPDTLQSKVFWILIGTNDYGVDHCSPESIVAGNIVIVQELRKRRPDATIVLNSILPRGSPGTNLLLEDDDNTWSRLTTINQWLECFANEQNEQVEFFNATNAFLGNNDASVKEEEYYADSVHPNTAGYAAWSEVIVPRVQELLGIPRDP